MKTILRTFALTLALALSAAPAAVGENHSRGRDRKERPARVERRDHKTERRAVPAQRSKDNGAVRVATERRAERASRPDRPTTTNRGGERRPGVGNGNKHNNGNNNNYRPGSGHGNNNNNGHRPGIGNGNNNRPGHDNGHRPGMGNGNNNRPGGDHGFRPGNDHGNRPGMGNGHRPDHRPGAGWGHAPGHGHNRPPMMRPPHRPHHPVMHRPHWRPAPPPHWRPRRGLPVIGGILGLTFGTAINVSLDYLFGNGYVVDGYGNDVVYLRNVNALNYMWDDAALYYGAGGLDASSFYYSTPVYNLSRYNQLYANLCNIYGPPVVIDNNVGAMGATWFGGNKGYISLSFGANSLDTGLRYLTTLTFGL